MERREQILKGEYIPIHWRYSDENDDNFDIPRSIRNPRYRRITNQEFLKSIEGKPVTPLEVFMGVVYKMPYQCLNCDNQFQANYQSILTAKTPCPYCREAARKNKSLKSNVH